MHSEYGGHFSGKSLFATTQWSMVLEASDSRNPQAAQALEALCQTYWKPIFLFFRRYSPSETDTEDLTQSFFTYLIEHRTLAHADRERGKFRSFLITSAKNFRLNTKKHANRLKRGGNTCHISINTNDADLVLMEMADDVLTPEESFDRAWAINLVHTALNQLETEYAKTGRRTQFEVMKKCLYGEDTTSYANLAANLNTTDIRFKTAIYRFRTRLYHIVRGLVADTVSDPGDNAQVEQELDHLFQCFNTSRRDRP
jgi:RNA polymerase sigma-70 factor (ECF subfamily)